MKTEIKINDQAFHVNVPNGYKYAALSESGRCYLFLEEPDYNETMQCWEGNGFATEVFYSRPSRASDTLVKLPEDSARKLELKRQAEIVMEMDKMIRSVNDEENGVFESWITYHLPDGANEEDAYGYCRDNADFYKECCEFFSREISYLFNHGDITKEGWSAEFWRDK